MPALCGLGPYIKAKHLIYPGLCTVHLLPPISMYTIFIVIVRYVYCFLALGKDEEKSKIKCSVKFRHSKHSISKIRWNVEKGVGTLG